MPDYLVVWSFMGLGGNVGEIDLHFASICCFMEI